MTADSARMYHEGSQLTSDGEEGKYRAMLHTTITLTHSSQRHGVKTHQEAPHSFTNDANRAWPDLSGFCCESLWHMRGSTSATCLSLKHCVNICIWKYAQLGLHHFRKPCNIIMHIFTHHCLISEIHASCWHIEEVSEMKMVQLFQISFFKLRKFRKKNSSRDAQTYNDKAVRWCSGLI